LNQHQLETLRKAVVLAKQEMMDTALRASQLGMDANALGGYPSEEAFQKWETAKAEAEAANADFEAKNTAYPEAKRALGV
jgi:hypothetical protein